LASPGSIRRGLAGLALLLIVGMARNTHAANGELADLVPRIKPSVVAVGTYQPTRNPAFHFRGTGFVVGDGLVVATNAHVLPESTNVAQSEVLAIARAEEGGRVSVRSAARMTEDPIHDLALLRLSGGSPLTALSLDGDLSAREGDSVGFSGFPLGAVLGLRPVTHRGIISAITPIGTPAARAQDLKANVVRRLGMGFDVLQLDATAYPGNSGSPLFDARTDVVVGIVNMVSSRGQRKTPSPSPQASPTRFRQST
jgi:S1-C subfamily serine protease